MSKPIPKTRHPEPRKILQSNPKQARRIKTGQKHFKHKPHSKVSVKRSENGEEEGEEGFMKGEGLFSAMIFA